MPYKPLTPCKHPGCAALTENKYCDKHKSLHTTDNRPSASRRGYNSKWQTARLYFLKAHPLCEECKRRGAYTPATVVDHIVPHKGDRNLFWDRNNWQSLCKQCHDRKTATEDGGFGRETKFC